MGFGLLIMNDDTTCANIVSKLLNACNHRELHKGKLFDCMVALWNTKDTLEPILFTNVNRLGIKGTQLVKGVGMLLNFNIIQMNPEDDVRIRFIRGRSINASAYVIIISSLDTMNSLWKLANESSPPDPAECNYQENESSPLDRAACNHLANESSPSDPAASNHLENESSPPDPTASNHLVNESSPPDPASSHRRYIEPKLHLSTKKDNLYTKAITMPSDYDAKHPSFHDGLSLVATHKMGLNSKTQTQMNSSAAASGTKNVPSFFDAFMTSTLGLGCGTNIQTQMNSTNLPVSSDPLTSAEPPEKLPQKSSCQNEVSIYSPSTGDGTSEKESSLPQGEDINSFLNGMGSLGSGLFWQGVYDYAHRHRLL